MLHISTRGQTPPVHEANAICMGLPLDGGLFAPEKLPPMPEELFCEARAYHDLAAKVLSLLFGRLGDLGEITQSAYSRFSKDNPAPLVAEPDGAFTLELFHGPTRAFKDMALQVLPGLMERARLQSGQTKKICILTATSGDTGKAALEAFAGRPGCAILVFFPQNGTSEVQEKQMTTQEGANVGVCALEGNFDDAQTGVKRLFTDTSFHLGMSSRGYMLSAANSVNIGRLAPQVVYYVHAYATLVDKGFIKAGDQINFCVPTGNFGNILAGLYAKHMGLPIGRLICASNRNRVLTDLLTTGRYSLNREFYTTYSPSMDILISSNFERALFLLSGNDVELTTRLMTELRTKRSFEMSDALFASFCEHFSAYTCNDEETLAEIGESFKSTGKMFDPHTAVARKCLRDYQRETGDTRLCVTLATADPYKFPETMLKALGRPSEENGFAAMISLSEFTNTPIPAALKSTMTKPVRFFNVTAPEMIREAAMEMVDCL
ncbi:MAG: threonine synthase [Oscillospiraceae bacterium]|nr:threonine synthase [Oscillospiraceae bacterium]